MLYQDQVVGVHGTLVMRCHSGVMTINCLCGAYAAVRPDHRQKGLLQALTKLNLQEMVGKSYHYIVTLSANAKSKAAVLKLAYQRIGLVNPVIRLKPPKVITENRLKSFARKIPILRDAYMRLKNLVRFPAMETISPTLVGFLINSIFPHENSSDNPTEYSSRMLPARNKWPI